MVMITITFPFFLPIVSVHEVCDWLLKFDMFFSLLFKNLKNFNAITFIFMTHFQNETVKICQWQQSYIF